MQRYTASSSIGLLDFLLGPAAIKRERAKQLLRAAAVQVNGQPQRQFDHPLAAGDVVTIVPVVSAAADQRLARAKIRILYEDDSLIIVDKPPGLLTVATAREKTDTLFVRLNEHLRQRNARGERVYVVHRLDQDTSGLVLFAKSQAIKDQLQADWPNIEKTYWAVVNGRPRADEGTITSYLTESRTLQVKSRRHPTPGARLATTHYRVEQVAGRRALLSVRLETGRKHQIRVHLAELGCAVVGDRRYGKEKKPPIAGLALHATRLTLTHPATAEILLVESPLPAALRRLLAE